MCTQPARISSPPKKTPNKPRAANPNENQLNPKP